MHFRFNEPRRQPGREARQRPCHGARLALFPPRDGEGCWENSAANQQAHDKEKPAEVDADDVPDDGEDGHRQAEDADVDVRDSHEAVRARVGLDIRLVDVEGQDRGDGDELGGGAGRHGHEQRD